METQAQLSGVLAAVATPVDGALQPHQQSYVGHCRWLLDNGCDGIVSLGTTGEAVSLTMEQRLRLIEALAISGLPMNRFLIGVSSCSVGEAIAFSRTALEAGADGLLLLPPFYFREADEDGLFAFYSCVAEALAGRAPRIYLYNFPRYSGIAITLSLTSRLREAFPGIFVGLKDSSGDFEHTMSFISGFPGFRVFSGSEAHLARNLEAGGNGCISATVNITAPLAAEVASLCGSAAVGAVQERLTIVREMITAENAIASIKGLLAEFLHNPTWRATLPPLLPRPAQEITALRMQIEEILPLTGLFSHS